MRFGAIESAQVTKELFHQKILEIQDADLIRYEAK
jgi:hypothetical protein